MNSRILAISLSLSVFFTLTRTSFTATEKPSSQPDRTTPIPEVTFVAFDTETTGFVPGEDKILEIGAVKFRDGKLIEEKTWLINPKRKIPYWAWRVHGIGWKMIKDQPDFKETYPEFKEFTEGCVLLAHNAVFDVDFISAEAQNIRRARPTAIVIDSLPLFRTWYPDTESHSLESLAAYLKLEKGGHHRALADSYYILRILNKRMKRKDAPVTLGDLIDDAGGVLKFK
ncbi:MAG: 3'-5' exonuclease [Verrucomicrobia bacterium]|nr:3'-5' exonuclease [Verrucomicrobiota bacterium]